MMAPTQHRTSARQRGASPREGEDSSGAPTAATRN
jgi:hypothetical protein